MAALREKGWDDSFAGLLGTPLLSICLKGAGQLAPGAFSFAKTLLFYGDMKKAWV